MSKAAAEPIMPEPMTRSFKVHLVQRFKDFNLYLLRNARQFRQRLPMPRLCIVYESRPRVCRMFPITSTDLRDRDLGLRHTDCGFHFASEKKGHSSLARSSRSQGAEFLVSRF
jgi:hypothetical protein